MARRINEQEPADRSKIRVFYAEVDGSTQSVQDLMRTLTAAIGRPAQHSSPSARIRHDNTPALSNVAQTDSLSSDQEGTEFTEGDPPEVVAEGDGESSTSKRKRGQGERTDRNAGIKLVHDLDFVPNGKTPLKSFFVEKSPTNDMEQVLVLAHYLQNTTGLDSFGPGHILTAFKHVGKPVPVDLKATIRNIKKSKAWINFTDIEKIRVTTEGDNRVEHELPKVDARLDDGRTSRAPLPR